MASVTQPIASCCQMQAPMPPPPRTQCGLSSCSSKFMPGTELGKDQRAACSSGEHDANSRRSPGESPLPTKAIPTRGLPSLHLKRRGERAAGFGRHAQSSSSSPRAHSHPTGCRGPCQGDLGRFAPRPPQRKTVARPHALRMCECALAPIGCTCC